MLAYPEADVPVVQLSLRRDDRGETRWTGTMAGYRVSAHHFG
jgi:hypothetical protein